MTSGKPFDVHLVNDSLVPRDPRQGVIAPTKRRIYHDTLGNPAGAVALVIREVGVSVTNSVPEQGITPPHHARNSLSIGVKQQFVGIESMAFVRRVGSMHSVAIKLSRAHFRQIAVPDLVGLF